MKTNIVNSQGQVVATIEGDFNISNIAAGYSIGEARTRQRTVTYDPRDSNCHNPSYGSSSQFTEGGH